MPRSHEPSLFIAALFIAARIMAAGIMVAGTGIAAAAGPTPAPEPGLRVITADALLADVSYLSAPALDGRLSGSPGYLEAARWAAARFAALGLEPGGDEAATNGSTGGRDWLQWLDAEYNEHLSAPRLVVTGADGIARELRPGPDFTARGFSGSGSVDSPVVFVGYGLSQPGRGHDDYAGVDVRDRIVLCFKPNPAWAPDSTGWDAQSNTPRQKSLVALAHGARGLLWCETSSEARPARAPIGSVLHGPGEQPLEFPQLEVSEAVADLLLGAPGEAGRLRAEIDLAKAPRSRALPAAAAMDVRASYERAHPTCNVVGLLRGSDPELAGQPLVIGAHLDHVGRQGPELYFPGANDNASGSAAVLRLAEAFANAGRRPARPVVFVLFAGEESGLEGAKHHAAHPLLPLADTVAMFNLDCVAHGDSVQVGSGRTSAALWARVRELDAANDACTVARTWGGGGADATPFHEGGVPALYWVTTNSYRYLHDAGDVAGTLNGPLYEKLVRLCFRAAWDVADGGRTWRDE